MRIGSALGVSLAICFAIATGAEDKGKSAAVAGPLNVKLGLWQMTYTSERNGIPATHPVAPELLAKMTPEQRARTEARIKSRASQGPQIETRLYCLTQERLRNAAFDQDANTTCQKTVLTSNGRLEQFHEQCTEGASQRTEDARFEAVDVDTMKGLLKVKTEGGNAYSMNVEIAGKWIAADCGSEGQ